MMRVVGSVFFTVGEVVELWKAPGVPAFVKRVERKWVIFDLNGRVK
jgi:hypothetical protein